MCGTKPKTMSESVVTTLISSATTLITAALAYFATIRAARVAARTGKATSQAGPVGEEEVRNQVSPPMPPTEN